ncbi:hypothetical protein HAX54_032286 [Datura stramonium]|uniref:TF-B3 domain-containing protein n=1 Tax=Datura stramonium TaxID=4076 RepID=A0ABS8RM16_DATST|nr:hypothetical protein [Datura stramonium]
MSFQKQMQNFDITLPQEEQPVEMVDRREEHPAEMVDRQEEQPAEMEDRREEQPAEMEDRWEEQTAEMEERREEQPAGRVDRRGEQPTEMVDRQEEQLADMVDRRGQEKPKPVDSLEITPHFFKIILSPHASKLHIPNEFVMEYGANLGDLVLLEVPNGVVWKVKLQNSNGMIWLNEGWNKFKEYYSIGCGYFLLFRYKGNAQFSVFIFDLSASEIEYPPGPNEDMTPENQHVVNEPPEENRVNLPPPGEPPEENEINFPPPGEPPAENRINLPPPGIYTMEELLMASMPSRPNV